MDLLYKGGGEVCRKDRGGGIAGNKTAPEHRQCLSITINFPL
jgi:hypothetical protein